MTLKRSIVEVVPAPIESGLGNSELGVKFESKPEKLKVKSAVSSMALLIVPVKSTVWPGAAVCEESTKFTFTSSAEHRPGRNKAQAQKIKAEGIPALKRVLTQCE